MKRLHQFLLLSVLLLCGTALTGQEFTGAEAEKRIPGAKTVLMGDQSEVPVFIAFREDARVPLAEFEAWERKVLGLDSRLRFVAKKEVISDNGNKHSYRTQQLNRITVNHSQSTLHHRGGYVYAVNYNIITKYSDTTIPAINESEAQSSAFDYLNVSEKDWRQIHFAANNILIKNQAGRKLEFIKANLSIFSLKNPVLVWKVVLKSRYYNLDETLYINAYTGEVVEQTDNRIYCVEGDANTSWRGVQDNIWTVDNGTNFILHDDCGNRNIRTRNEATGNEFTDSNNLWFTGGFIGRGAHTTHWAMRRTYDYYLNTFGREGYYDNGDVIVWIEEGLSNAFFSSTDDDITIGLGNDDNTDDDDKTTLDWCGHEFTHGVLFDAGINYDDLESRSLHEGIADIFGNNVEGTFEGLANIDWEWGDRVDNSDVRSFSDPNIDNSPDTYMGTNWGGSQHRNGGVIRHWMFLLSDGGSGTNDNGSNFNVTGQGVEFVSELLYNAINSGYFGSSPNFFQARTATLQAAADMGFESSCDEVRNQIERAWTAVGVGGVTGTDISISNLTTNLPNNTASPGETFTATFNLRGTNYDNGTYVGYFLRSWCTSSVLYSPFEVDYEQLTCDETTTHTTQVTLPTGLAPGQYTLIARSDVFNWVTESSTWNDRACRTITIQDNNPAPDLRPLYCSNSPSTVQAGNSISTSTNLENDGTAYAGSSTMGYYLSTNTTYNPGTDVYLGNRSFPGLTPGSTSYKTQSLTIPGNTSAGNYYILTRADMYNQVNEGDNEGNNVKACAITVTAPPANLPDLIITAVNPGPDFGSPPYVNKGSNLSIAFNLVNQGSNPVGNSTIKVYLSSNSSFPTNSTPLRTMYNQQPGPKNTTIFIPSNQSPGFWYILVRADANNSITESVESNNYDYGFCQINFNFNKPSDDPTTDTKLMNTEEVSSTFADRAMTDIQLFPNPTSSDFTVTYPVQEANEVSITLRSSTGQILRTALLSPGEQTGKWQQDVGDLPPGVYLLSWYNNNERITRRLVIQ